MILLMFSCLKCNPSAWTEVSFELNTNLNLLKTNSSYHVKKKVFPDYPLISKEQPPFLPLSPPFLPPICMDSVNHTTIQGGI